MTAPDILWRLTWPDDEEDHEDYTAIIGGKEIGRVYKRVRGGSNPNLWRWNLLWGGPDAQGHCASRVEALAMVEQRYAQHLNAKAKPAQPEGLSGR